MSRITKQIAENVAQQMVSEKKKANNAVLETLKSKIAEAVKAKIPSQVLNFQAAFPD
jgi:hypothetical protein